MKKLTSRERFARMFEHRDADRVPIIDEPLGRDHQALAARRHAEGNALCGFLRD